VDCVRVGTQPAPRHAAGRLVVVFVLPLRANVHVQDGPFRIHLHVLDLVRAGDDFDAVDEVTVLIVERGGSTVPAPGPARLTSPGSD